jgi:hypothetical protein
MNVPPPQWASLFNRSAQPLSPVLRSVFEPHGHVPADFDKLLQRLERGSIRQHGMR